MTGCVTGRLAENDFGGGAKPIIDSGCLTKGHCVILYSFGVLRSTMSGRPAKSFSFWHRGAPVASRLPAADGEARVIQIAPRIYAFAYGGWTCYHSTWCC